MALQKTFTLNNGAVGNYIKISRIIVDKLNFTVHVSLSLFTNSTFHDGFPIAQDFKQYSFDFTRAEFSGDIIAQCYTKISDLNDPDLSGAISI